MYNLPKNNHYLNKKNSTIYTPPAVSEFLFNLLLPLFADKQSIILDPGCGSGNLLKPWKTVRYRTIGIEIDRSRGDNGYIELFADFLQLPENFYSKTQLILCNPPFNVDYPPLGSETWLDKIVELFGKEIPIVLFAPIGFRLNGKQQGKRWAKFTNQEYPPISSIISLPCDIFGVEFHTEILIFNIPNLQPHYFYQPNHEQKPLWTVPK